MSYGRRRKVRLKSDKVLLYGAHIDSTMGISAIVSERLLSGYKAIILARGCRNGMAVGGLRGRRGGSAEITTIQSCYKRYDQYGNITQGGVREQSDLPPCSSS